MIYDYLFYKSCQLAKKSRNWRDTPLLHSVMIVGSGLVFNLGTILFLFQFFSGVSILDSAHLDSWKYFYAFILCAFVYFYYSYKDRGKKIILKYDKKYENNLKKNHPAIPIIFYFLLSHLFLFLSAMLRNGDLKFS